MGRKLAVATMLVAGLGAGSAVAAQRAVTFDGATGDRVAVKLTVASSGNATAFRVGAYEIECQKRGTLSNKAYTHKDLDTSDPGAFSDKRTSSSEDGRFRFKSKSKVAGAATADGTSWSGTYKSTTKVLERGDKIDTCKVKTTWDAD